MPKKANGITNEELKQKEGPRRVYLNLSNIVIQLVGIYNYTQHDPQNKMDRIPHRVLLNDKNCLHKLILKCKLCNKNWSYLRSINLLKI